LVGTLLAITQAGRTSVDPFARIAGALSTIFSALVFKLRRLGFSPIRYRQLPFWAWGLTWNFIQHLLLWKFRLRMRTLVELERIMWRTSKVFVFGNAYNVILVRPARPSTSGADEPSPPIDYPVEMKVG
jgi:hypothetical protein